MEKKTLTLKKPGTSMEAPLPQDAPGEGNSGHAPVMAAIIPSGGRVGRSASYTASGIAGLIAIILLGTLLALQFIESSGYKGAIPTKGFVATPVSE